MLLFFRLFHYIEMVWNEQAETDTYTCSMTGPSVTSLGNQAREETLLPVEKSCSWPHTLWLHPSLLWISLLLSRILSHSVLFSLSSYILAVLLFLGVTLITLINSGSQMAGGRYHPIPRCHGLWSAYLARIVLLNSTPYCLFATLIGVFFTTIPNEFCKIWNTISLKYVFLITRIFTLPFCLSWWYLNLFKQCNCRVIFWNSGCSN